jgi:HAE1 family hydrophobic/amphiphilic exporter-1
LGISIIGGLTIATVMTLVVVPSVYCIFQGFAVNRERRAWARELDIEQSWKKQKRRFLRKRK